MIRMGPTLILMVQVPKHIAFLSKDEYTFDQRSGDLWFTPKTEGLDT